MTKAETVTTYGLKIPHIGFFLLTCRGIVISSLDTENFLRELFEDKKIIIMEIPDITVIYKEIIIENVCISERDTIPYIYKWSRNGIAILLGYWKSKEEKILIKENLEKFLKS